MALHSFDLPSFQAAVPPLAATDPTVLASTFGNASIYLNPNDGCLLTGNVLQLALNLLTAHLLQISNTLTSGAVAAPIAGATEGSVAITLVPPPAVSGWQFWLASTPYGQQLWALLSMQGAGGFMIGGSLERRAFRKAGGIF